MDIRQLAGASAYLLVQLACKLAARALVWVAQRLAGASARDKPSSLANKERTLRVGRSATKRPPGQPGGACAVHLLGATSSPSSRPGKLAKLRSCLLRSPMV